MLDVLNGSRCDINLVDRRQAHHRGCFATGSAGARGSDGVTRESITAADYTWDPQRACAFSDRLPGPTDANVMFRIIRCMLWPKCTANYGRQTLSCRGRSLPCHNLSPPGAFRSGRRGGETCLPTAKIVATPFGCPERGLPSQLGI